MSRSRTVDVHSAIQYGGSLGIQGANLQNVTMDHEPNSRSQYPAAPPQNWETQYYDQRSYEEANRNVARHAEAINALRHQQAAQNSHYLRA